MMRRREFITLLGGAAAAWPPAARGQQSAVPVIGFLNATGLDYRVDAFREGLRETGFAEGQNVSIEYRWADGQYDRLPAMAADLVRRKVAVIVAGGGGGPAFAARAATDTIPIVFTLGGDPVASGAAAGLNRPGSNMTGIGQLATSLRPKQIEVLHEAVPSATVIGLLVNPAIRPTTETTEDDRKLQAAADALGLRLVFAKARAESEFEGAFASLVQNRIGALVIYSNALFNSRRDHLITLAAKHSIPAVYPYREYAAAGGLMSYGTSIADAYRLAGVYAGRILRGEKAADLPVQLLTKVELIVNLKTARSLRLTLPESLLARADEVIE
jgi:putative ABC transport system substrate-binding protein